MKRFKVAAIAVSALFAAGAAGAQPALHTGHAGAHYAGEKMAGQAKVSMAAARTIALNAHPGRITDQELEKEGGGSGLRYSFDIKNGGKTFEVGVDAQTGKVLENKGEGANPD